MGLAIAGQVKRNCDDAKDKTMRTLVFFISYFAGLACAFAAEPTPDEIFAAEVQQVLGVPDRGTGLIDAMRMLRDEAARGPESKPRKLPAAF